MRLLAGGAFRGWSGHECGALISAITTLVKEAPEDSLNPSDFWGHSKKMPSWTRKKVLTRHQTCWCLSLERAASGTLRNECLFRSQWYLPVRGILLQQPNGLRQWASTRAGLEFLAHGTIPHLLSQPWLFRPQFSNPWARKSWPP